MSEQPAVGRALVRSAMAMTWIGLLAIGASGLLAWGLGSAFGPAFVSGDIPGVTYTAERCAELEEYAPADSSCGEAAAFHHYDETVTYREAAGVLGLLVLLSWLAAYWRRPRTGLPSVGLPSVGLPSAGLPAGLTDAAGVALFGVVGLALAASGLSLLAQATSAGAGADMSASTVSLVVAAIFVVRLRSALRAG